MAKKIGFGIMFLFLLVIVIFGCIQQKDDSKIEGVITGTDGLVIEFYENYPRSNYVVSEDGEDISVIIDVSNKGTYSPEEDAGRVYISGFDENIIEIENAKALDARYLPGVSSFNPVGGFQTVEFENGRINADNIMTDKYETTILATVCYPYVTKAGPSVCIDPKPFDTKQNKVCEIGSQTLTSQGAPIAVTRIDQEASTNKIQFKITIKNVGNGDVIMQESLGKCDPNGVEPLGRDDFDRLKLVTAKVGTTELRCGPFADGSNDIIRLFNGEGFIVCSLDMPENIKSAYTTPLILELSYGYRSTISRQIEISKITTVT